MKARFQIGMLAVILTLAACGGNNSSTGAGSPPEPSLTLVDGFPGMRIYPGFNVVSEDDQTTLSMSSGQSIEVLRINGEDQVLEDGNSWMAAFELTPGDNIFDFYLQAGTEYTERSVTVRYQGIIPHGSAGAALTDNGGLVVDDYRRDALVRYSIDTPFVEAFEPASVEGFPESFGSFAARGNDVYFSAWDEVAETDKIYRLDTSTYSFETLFDPQQPYFNTDAFALSDDGATLYFFGESILFGLELATGALNEIASADASGLDEEFSYAQAMVADNTSGKILISTVEYIYDPQFQQVNKFISVDLEGANAGLFQRIDLSSETGCLTDINDSWFYAAPRIYDGSWYLAESSGSVLKLDAATGCIASVLQISDADYPNSESLQGIDYDPVNQEIYLGYFSGAAKYNQVTELFSYVEPKGFAEQHYLFEEPLRVAVDTATSTIFTTFENTLVAHSPVSAETEVLATLSDDIAGLYLDSANGVLYVGDESGELGMHDLASGEYTQLLAPGGPYDIEALAQHSDGTLYFLDGDVVYRVAADTLEVTLLSGALTDGIEIWRDDDMVIDEAGNRLITNSEINDLFYFVAIDLETGARSLLNPDTGIDGFFGEGFLLGSDGSHILFTVSEQLMRFDLATATPELLFSEQDGSAKFGELTGIAAMGEGELVIGDDDKNGFWYLNMATGERTFIQ